MFPLRRCIGVQVYKSKLRTPDYSIDVAVKKVCKRYRDTRGPQAVRDNAIQVDNGLKQIIRATYLASTCSDHFCKLYGTLWAEEELWCAPFACCTFTG